MSTINDYLMISFKIALILYASQIAPGAPDYLVSLFHKTYIKIILIFLMAYFTNYDFQFSLIFALILVMGMNVASGKQILENYKNTNLDGPADYSNDYKTVGNFKLLEPMNEIVPGCENIKYTDLLKIFDNDQDKLQTSAQHALYELFNTPEYQNSTAAERLKKTVYMAGIPGNLEINDENSPWIASLLVNYNFIVSNTCKAPGY